MLSNTSKRKCQTTEQSLSADISRILSNLSSNKRHYKQLNLSGKENTEILSKMGFGFSSISIFKFNTSH